MPLDRSEQRWADVERRLTRLEEQLTDGPPVRHDPGEESVFWVLEGLRAAAEPTLVYAGRVELPKQNPIEWQMGHRSSEVLDREWTELAPVLSALGHPVRLQILQLVARGEAATAAELAATTDLGSTGQIYHHLRQLVAAGWLQTRGKGRHVVPPERVVPLMVIVTASS